MINNTFTLFNSHRKLTYTDDDFFKEEDNSPSNFFLIALLAIKFSALIGIYLGFYLSRNIREEQQQEEQELQTTTLII